LLLYPQGLDYIAAFFACLYAGVVAVPTYPPRRNRPDPRLTAIAIDAQATLILTTSEILSDIAPRLAHTPELKNQQWLATDNLADESANVWQTPEIDSETLAFLQYTSGSTGTPKGVMVNHGNLLHNSEYIKQAFELSSDSVSVTWLPNFHDMGLIDGIIQPLYTGFLGVIMPSVSFIQHPLRWLQAISRYKATHCGGPNFGYELCVRKITQTQRKNIDLSSWSSAYNGAEPIRGETLELFTEAFKSCGFRANFFYPCYGMAETTLMVSGGQVKDAPVFYAFQAKALEKNKIVEASEQTEKKVSFVGCGRSWLDTKIIIANPDSLTQCSDNEVGEIWVSGRSIAQGYWKRPHETKQTFHAYLADTGEGPFLRTGDLGFLKDGELFVTGRLKDLIIIRGQNYYPQDIELTVEKSHKALNAGGGAAFSVEKEGEERLIIVQEVQRTYLRKLNSKEVLEAIRQAVFEQHELPIYAILLLKPGQLPKTSSGKVQRRACREPFLAESFKIVGKWQPDISIPPASAKILQLLQQLKNAASLEEYRALLPTYLQEQVAVICQLDINQIDHTKNLIQIGLDSLMAAELGNRLMNDLNVNIPVVEFLENASIENLVEQVAEQWQKTRAAINIDTPSQTASVFLSAIVSAPEQRYQPFPLTDIQQAYWMGRGGTFELGNVSTHIYLELDCHGLNLERLNEAWQTLIDRHDMLRMVVLPTGQQHILEQVSPYQIALVDLHGQAPVTTQLEKIRQQMSHQVLPADQWPLFEIRATRLDEQRTRLHLSFDALMIDAWSLHCLVKEWSQLYQNPQLALTPLELSFRDYILTEQAWQETELYQRSLDYWFNRLDTLPPAPELPLAQNPATLTQPRFKRHTAQLDPKSWQRLKQRALEAGLTPSGVLFAAFSDILTVWSKQPQFTLNLTHFNRWPINTQINDIIGDFTSLLLLEINNSTPDTFVARGMRLQRQLWQDFEHRDVSGVRVLRELTRQQSGTQKASMPIVFTSTLALTASEQEDFLAFQFGEVVYSITQTPQVWLDHQVLEQGGALVFNWDAIEDLFPEGMLDDMFDAYCRFLRQLARSESAWLETSTRALVPPRQLSQRAAVNATQAPVSDELLHTLFIAQVQARGHEYAVISSQRTLTYLELFQFTNQVGRKLRQLGASPNTLVAVVMEKGWEQVVGVLGILMSGAAYLPIDPELPKERQWYLLEHGEVKLVLTQSQFNQDLAWPEGLQRLCLDNEDFSEITGSFDESVQKPTDLAYVIFTSGSTGQPKGVMIDHRGAVNTLKDINQRFGVGCQDRVLALSALNFDLSVYDIFGILAAGGTVVMPDADLAKEPAHWLELMNQHHVTVWNTVPALMQMLVDYVGEQSQTIPSKLRLSLMSGDWIPLDLPERVKALWPQTQVISLGGATEASIWSIYYPIETIDPTWKSIPYGKPLLNQTFQVFNELMEPCPIWVPGQLYIGGIGLALGYWRDEEKTRNSFIIHPHTQERLYKTGDLGRYLPDGNIEFLGREDFQVKIRGYRIELGEIESALKQHPGVEDAVVSTEENKHLVAYVVPYSDQLFEIEKTKDVENIWSKLLQTGREQARQLPSEPKLQALSAFEQSIEWFSLFSICHTLKKLGIFVQSQEKHSVDELLHRYQIKPDYQKLLAQWFTALEEKGLLQRIGEDTFVNAHPLPTDSLDKLWQDVRQDAEQVGLDETLLHYFQLSVENHIPLLKGEVNPLELLFPDGNWSTAESLYQSNPLMEYHNNIACHILGAIVREWSSEKKIRILEVGAGIGGMTASLLPVLPSQKTVYTYTDLTTFFTTQAKEKFHNYPFVQYKLLDIDQEPVSQGYEPHTYDVIVAANVLHDARHIGTSLQYLLSLLAPGGFLLILEGTQNTYLQMISVRFIEGFSHYEDERIHTNQPLLSVEKWHNALSSAGFKAFVAFPESDFTAGLRDQHVMVAQAPSSIKHFKPDELLNYMQQKLPDYMVPSVYIPLEAFPLTPNGKVDRNALPTLESLPSHSEKNYVAPRTPTEEMLVKLWSELLKVEQISLHDDFFDLGGDSLLATQLMSRLRDTFSIELPLRYLFESPTVVGLAETIENYRFEQSLAPPIQVIERTDNLPLSFAQERLWFLSQLEGGNAAYNLPAVMRLTGALSITTLEHSLNEIVQRHETLRSIFKSVNGTPVVQVLDFHYQLPVIDLQHLPVEAQTIKVQQLVTEQAGIPFDLTQVPLFRFLLIQLSSQEYVFLLIIHHIIADGWSMGLFTQELTSLYQAFAKGKPSPLPALPIQYVDFAHWQRRWLSGEVLYTQLKYWRSQLAGVPPVLEMPTDRARPAVQSFRGRAESFAIPLAMKQKLNALSQQSETTLFMVLLAAFVVLLYRYSEKEDIVVGSPIANRNRTDLEGIIGFFANTLPLRIDLSGNPTFIELLERARKVTMAAYAHQDVPFEKLVETLQPERNLSYNPLVQVIFAQRNTHSFTMDVAELSVTPLTLKYETGIFDLFLELQEVEEGFSGTVMYSTDLFDAITITRLIGYFQTLLENIVANPQQPVAELPLLTETGLAQLTTQLTPVDELGYPNQCLHQWFEAQVEKTPDAVAVIGDNKSLSYRDLNTRSNQLAHQLRAMGVAPDVCVGIYMERALEMVVGLLGILKAGGAFLPLAPEYPDAFVTRMLAETQAPVLLSQAHLVERLPKLSQVQTICLSPDWQAIAQQSQTNLDSEITVDNLAYVIYSTTQSIQITHQAMAQRLAWLQKTLTLSESDIVLQKTPLGQDTAFWEIFGPLVTGGRVVLATSMDNLPHLIATHQISLLHLLPSELSVFVETVKFDLENSLNSLRWVLCSGEPLRQTLVDAFFQSEKMAHCGLHYFYRLPEAAGEIMSQHCHPGERREIVTLGRPTYRAIDILDKQLQSVPWGGKGEIYVANSLGADAPWLKTGELGHLLNDGTIERLGSRHQYAWIDGFRVDLTVIEATLLSEPSVEECRILARETNNFHYKLVAYVVMSGRFSPERLSAHLQIQLPAYMLPYAYVPLSSLPLTTEGDVDKPALARLEVIDTAVIQQWENQLQARPEIEQVAVVAQTPTEHLPPLHLSDLLPEWKHAAPMALDASLIAPVTPFVPKSADLETTVMAFSDGGALVIEENAPKTLTDALIQTATHFPDKGIFYIQPDGSSIFQSYATLLETAKCLLNGLSQMGLKPNDKVILQIDALKDYFPTFWACVLGGITPVTVAIAPTYGDKNSVVNKLFNIWTLLEQPPILASNTLIEAIEGLKHFLPMEQLSVLSIQALRNHPPTDSIHPSQPNDLVFFQLTSGSTGTPKCIQETHQGIICHIQGSQQFNGYQTDNVSLNWLPMDHVVPILTYHLKDVYLGCQQVEVPTSIILSNPLKWLDLIEKYRVTHSWSPNFGFKLVSEQLAKVPTRTWDLSSIQSLMNAGEQVTFPVVHDFLTKVAPFKVPAHAMQPAFGMAEVCTCMTYQNQFSLETGVHRFDKSSLSGHLKKSKEEAPAIDFVDLGSPMPGVQIRITDQDNQLLPEGVIGRLQIKGQVVTPGYFNNPAANQEAFVGDGWFNTGDLGFILNGRLTLTGREKEIIIIHGANFYCYEIEDVVNGVAGVEPTYVGACAISDTGTEGLAIFFTPTGVENNIELFKTIRTEVASNLGISPSYVIPVAKSEFPKTTSGKIQRTQLKKQLETGQFQDIIKQIDIALENANTLPDWFYQKHWRRNWLSNQMAQMPTGTYLVFMDSLELGTALCQELEPHTCIRVEMGRAFTQLSAYHYCIVPSEPAHYQRLLASLDNDGIQVSQILHLWTYDEYAGEVSSLAALESAQVRGIYSLLFLVQALAKTQYAAHHQLRLNVISSHVQPTQHMDKLAYEKSTLIGLLKTIPLELSWLQCRHIDLEVGPSIEKNAAHILTELSAFKGDSEVAYRNDKRLIPVLAKVDMQKQEIQSPAIKPGGIYLITGGLGGIGTFMSQFLLEKYHAKLIIIGRTALPDRETWASHLEQNTHIAKRLKNYLALEKVKGGEFIYQAVDVCDFAGLQQIIADAENKWHESVSGIVHLAGELAGESTLASHWQVAEKQRVAVTTQSSFETMLRAKVYGTWTLYQLIKDNPTAIFLAFSSVNGLFGGASFSAYSTANSFLDGCSFYQQHHGHRNSYCLSWSLWDDIGMSHGNPISTREASHAMGYHVISKERGLYSLLAALSRTPTHLIVGLDASNPYIQRFQEKSVALQKLGAYFTANSNDLSIAQLQVSEVQDIFGTTCHCDFVQIQTMPLTDTGNIDKEKLVAMESRIVQGSKHVEPRTELERQLARIWQEVLDIPNVSIEDNFFALGGHSLLATQMISRMQEVFEVELPVQSLFERATVAGIAEYIEVLRIGAEIQNSANNQENDYWEGEL
jgi:amino acid adenylation domain-containing protein